MRRITIRRAHTWHYRKIRPCIEQSNGPVSLSPSQSCPDCITNTSGYDFRKGHPPPAPCRAHRLADEMMTPADLKRLHKELLECASITFPTRCGTVIEDPA